MNRTTPPQSLRGNRHRMVGSDMARCDKNPEIDLREDVVNELLALCPDTLTTVVSLCIVWDGGRRERNWMSRITSTKEALK
ncbi:hypothetical protein NEOLEDRAFT_558104 [Neolentinus lepideus HHB14362 ss-1]|uniref:Uncharacterized protein n=1 Tax=Neolentinus lepideus HHB14362 ss-1 TaxID=1314782 RepID=A0A165R5P4_9AGAM|nr:hypothetical protein NEOLEDRAFT_558104 [Neolentinus lepideus HHB14362 ss-1]